MALTWKGDVVSARLQARCARATRAITTALLDATRDECPVDTGALRASIREGSSPDPTVGVVEVPIDYAPYVVFGHIHARSGRHVPPNPFPQRAALRVAAQARDLIDREFRGP